MRSVALWSMLFAGGCAPSTDEGDETTDDTPGVDITGTWTATELMWMSPAGGMDADDEGGTWALEIRATGVGDFIFDPDSTDPWVEVVEIADGGDGVFTVKSWAMDLDYTVVGDEGDCIDSGMVAWDFEVPDTPIGAFRLSR